MNRLQVHRGPDGEGIWTCNTENLSFGHRRLSILDLSPEGAQPKSSRSGNYVITFNGEIYNYASLRSELTGRGIAFHGTSDTEVVLAGFDAWGVPGTISRISGMFAIAVWDERARTLTLVRDRVGEKPLYYKVGRDGLQFASELKAITGSPGFDRRLSGPALAGYFRLGYVPGPLSIYEGVMKLEPGTAIEFRRGASIDGKSMKYWHIPGRAEPASTNGGQVDVEEDLARFDSLLTAVVREQMVSDVPLGAFLSGGVDSSLVVAKMQSLSNRPVKTFSIGFEDKRFNEAGFAADVARHLGTDHHSLIVSHDDVLSVIPGLASIFDEPFCDSSAIPTLLVSRMAREKVTVALTGDGGDETFLGYTRYHRGLKIHSMMNALPAGLMSRAGGLLQEFSGVVAMCTGARRARILKVASAMQDPTFSGVFSELVSLWPEQMSPGRDLDRGGDSWFSMPREIFRLGDAEALGAFQYIDMAHYLPDDILVKVDRISMSVSLETRAPLLDHRLVEFAASLPMALKFSGVETKIILKKILARHVPVELTDRPKMGFGVPLADWLRGSLLGWADDLLADRPRILPGSIDWEIVKRLWQDHKSGRQNHEFLMWNALVLADWCHQND